MGKGTYSGLLGLGVLDVLGLQHVPVILEGSSGNSLLVNLDGVGVVWVEDHGVQVSELVSLTRNVLLQEVVLSIIVEDEVDLLGGGTANIRTKHNATQSINILSPQKKQMQNMHVKEKQENTYL